MGAPKKAPQKVLVTLFPYIFHLKTEWNIVCEYLKTKTFSRGTNILPQMHWTSNNFGNSATTTGSFGYHKTIQSLTSRKQYAQKTSGYSTGEIFMENFSFKTLWVSLLMFDIQNLGNF